MYVSCSKIILIFSASAARTYKVVRYNSEPLYLPRSVRCRSFDFSALRLSFISSEAPGISPQLAVPDCSILSSLHFNPPLNFRSLYASCLNLSALALYFSVLMASAAFTLSSLLVYLPCAWLFCVLSLKKPAKWLYLLFHFELLPFFTTTINTHI